ncbi:MAG: beta-lactamase family protein [Fuerstiella sp.]|nr:beta-lactamase family protein [Fuerstiella sp.]
MDTQQRLNEIACVGGLKYADVSFGTPSRCHSLQFTHDSSQTVVCRTNNQNRYLAASITKPITAMAIIKLAAEGHLSLAEPISTFLPNFKRAAIRRTTVRHLLTHTSGFPDMLPNNAELRAAHASLDEFVCQAVDVELEFRTATDCRYSSIGFLLLGAIVEVVTGQKLGVFLNEHFFEPLEMTNTWLGMSPKQANKILPTVLPSILPAWQPNAQEWGWNSQYWRTLGAPWGGMISNARDLGRYAEMVLRHGCDENGKQLLPETAVIAAVSDQTARMAAQRDFVGIHRGWGFGWRREWPSHSASFGDFVSTNTVGHWGATGTMMWMDLTSNRYSVILTTTPYEDSQAVIQRMSNVTATAPV